MRFGRDFSFFRFHSGRVKLLMHAQRLRSVCWSQRKRLSEKNSRWMNILLRHVRRRANPARGYEASRLWCVPKTWSSIISQEQHLCRRRKPRPVRCCVQRLSFRQSLVWFLACSHVFVPPQLCNSSWQVDCSEILCVQFRLKERLYQGVQDRSTLSRLPVSE